MRSSKHIVFFAPSFPKDETNTIVTPPVHLLARSLMKLYQNELKVTVVALHYPFSKTKYRCFGIDVYPIGASHCRYPKRLWYWRDAVRKISQIHHTDPISLIHTFWLNECAFLVEYFLRHRHIPHLSTMMGQDVLSSNRFLRLLKDRRLPKVAISTMQNNELLKRNIQPAAHVIPWGFDGVQVSDNAVRPIDVLSAASFIPLKRMEETIAVIHILEKSFGASLNCVFAGDGALREKLELQVSKMNLNSKIEFKGKVAREEVMQLMSKTKVLLHPSVYEAGPMVALEALGNGCNVVSRNVGLAIDIETDKWKTGDSIETLANHVRFFLETPDNQPFVHRTFDEVARLYHELYQKIISRVH